ncbi:MAG: hypothetical protein RsTaC01_0126 [Candidatus Paraimprobicoccus trichonymphae]|uniref:Uncharacterized protein n=1 Tax=Candidatus Paraimprobicoccus trichonymphae TaxID=3033793 RepID=A0AA48L196_9FIRM|nr:MAG: hypothetical protein RsTaC01_0126 [Candidatus Paraimprobicoccus trichonymphae]
MDKCEVDITQMDKLSQSEKIMLQAVIRKYNIWIGLMTPVFFQECSRISALKLSKSEKSIQLKISKMQEEQENMKESMSIIRAQLNKFHSKIELLESYIVDKTGDKSVELKEQIKKSKEVYEIMKQIYEKTDNLVNELKYNKKNVKDLAGKFGIITEKTMLNSLTNMINHLNKIKKQIDSFLLGKIKSNDLLQFVENGDNKTKTFLYNYEKIGNAINRKASTKHLEQGIEKMLLYGEKLSELKYLPKKHEQMDAKKVEDVANNVSNKIKNNIELLLNMNHNLVNHRELLYLAGIVSFFTKLYKFTSSAARIACRQIESILKNQFSEKQISEFSVKEPNKNNLDVKKRYKSLGNYFENINKKIKDWFNDISERFFKFIKNLIIGILWFFTVIICMLIFTGALLANFVLKGVPIIGAILCFIIDAAALIAILLLIKKMKKFSAEFSQNNKIKTFC